jgi:adenylate cyclase
MKKIDFQKYKKISLKSLIAVCSVSILLYISIYFCCQNFFEPRAYDFLVWLSSQKKASSEIVTVAIDNESLIKVGRWPWKRTYYADVFEYLEKYGNARLVVFDSLIRSKDNSKDDQEFFNRVNKLDKIVFSTFFSKYEKDFVNGDDEDIDKILKSKFSVFVDDNRSDKLVKLSEYSGISHVLYDMLTSAKNMGSVMVYPDKDGIIRKYEPIIYFKNAYYPSLSLEVLSKLQGKNKFVMEDNKITSDNFKMPLYSSKHGSYTYIKWYKPFSKEKFYSHESYKAWQVLKSFNQIKQGEKPMLSPDIFKDKIVVVGATATALHDIKVSPLGSGYPGVDIQATCIDNILNNDFVYKISPAFRVSILIAVVIITLLAVIFLIPMHSTILVLLLLIGYFNICAYFAYPNNIMLDITIPPAFIFCSLTIGYGYKYIRENGKKRKIQKAMEKYVSKDVMSNVLRHIDDVKLGGKRADISVLLADIRGFTSISENLEPEQVSALLNSYFSEMHPIILEHNGMLNKYMGDALLAVFGAPVENQEHPYMAVKCAIKMLDKVKELQKKWFDQYNCLIDIGIAISTGDAFLGNIGSEDRLEYTVIGDTVNVASRIESLNKVFNTHLLISDMTYKRIDKIVAFKLSSVPIRGKAEPIDIYEVVNLVD